MTGQHTAPRSPAPPAGGGAPRPLAVEHLDRLRTGLEALEGRTVAELTPFVEDLEHAADALHAVDTHLGAGSTPPPRPAPRHDTAVASAVGVLADAPA